MHRRERTDPQIHQCFLSNDPAHYQAVEGLTAMKQQIVEIPIEQIVTVENSAGQAFAPGGGTAWAWLEEQGKEVWGYLNAARPEAAMQPTSLPHERDPYWFRREHAIFLRENGLMVDDIYADPRSQKYKDYIIPKIVGTGVKAILFDNATLDSSKVSWAVEDWFEIYDALRANGIKVYGNGLWQKGYAMEHCDGFQCELWVGNRPHYIKPDGQWGALTEYEFATIARHWVEAGKVANMLVRWRPGESVFSNYDEFCTHYMTLAETCGAVPSFALHDYHRSGWRDWMAKHVEPEDTFVKRLIERAEASQAISLNPFAALQRAALGDELMGSYAPVGPEFKIKDDNGETVVAQKFDPLTLGEDGKLPDPRVYFALDGQWDVIEHEVIPRKTTTRPR